MGLKGTQRHVLVLVTVFALCGLFTTESSAEREYVMNVWQYQGGQSLSYGLPVTSVLDDVTYREVYNFVGIAGEIIEINMSRTDGDLDPLVLLTDAQGLILAASDDDGIGIDARIDFFRLPSDGRYFVVAARYGQMHGSTTGEFTLLLDRVTDSTNAEASTTLQYGDNVRGRISPAVPRVFYFFRAERGAVIDVVMQRTSGSLDPRLDLATTDGLVLVSNDDDPQAEGTLDAAIRKYTIREPGIYLVVATRFGDLAGDTEGTYSLALSTVSPDDLGQAPEDARLIDYGMVNEGSISDEMPQRYFRFDARRGDVITVTMTSEQGNLDPVVKLLDTSLNELASDNDGGDEGKDARIAAFTLPASGKYYIVATRFGEESGQTDGEFYLYLSGRPGIMGGESLEIAYDTVVSGQINDLIVDEEYIFFGSDGDEIRVSMARASGDLDSLVTLLDGERKQIAFDDDSGRGEKDALIDRFVLPHDGLYFLVASRFERETGATNGAYILELRLLRAGS